MLQRSKQPYLAQETVWGENSFPIVIENLDRDIAILRDITRKKYRSHPAAAEPSLDCVAG